jgi:hypothetical protein
MKRALGAIALLLVLTACGDPEAQDSDPSALDNCVEWVSEAHPDVDPYEACASMAATDIDGFMEAFG